MSLFPFFPFGERMGELLCKWYDNKMAIAELKTFREILLFSFGNNPKKE